MGKYNTSDSYGMQHYKYDGIKWTQLTNLPYPFGYGQDAVAFNNEILVFSKTNGIYSAAVTCYKALLE